MSDLFVGADRQAIVDDLLADFEAVKAGEGSRMVTLVAPSGWGKTRIVQEFYAALAARQEEPGYWPARIVDEPAVDDEGPAGAIGALTAARKSVFPRQVAVPAGAVMEWMWWGVSCERRQGGDLVDALREDADQLYAHAEALSGTPIGLAGGAERTFDMGSNVVGVLGLLGMAVPPVGVAITVAGAAKAGWDNRDLFGRLKDWRRRRKEQEEGRLVEVGGAHEREDEELIRRLAKLSEAMPLVVVVDDAHLASASMVGTIRGLCAAEGSRVLVIATAWASHLGGRYSDLPFAAWLGAQGTRMPHRYIALQQLALDQAELLIGEELPQAAGIAAQITERYGGNLLGIRALLRLPRVRRAARRGPLTQQFLDELPDDVSKLFAEHWDGLPEDLRVLLSLAAEALGPRYLPGVVIAAAEAVELVDDPRATVDASVDPYAWARALDECLYMFIDPLLHQVAQQHAGSMVGPDEIAAAHRAVVHAAVNIDTATFSPAAAEALLSRHVVLAQEGLIAVDAGASDSAFALAERHADRYEYSEAINLAQFSIRWSGIADSDQVLFRRYNLASWLGGAGRVDEAIAQFAALLEDRMRVLGADHPDTLRTRHNLAFWLGEAGRVDEAIAQFTTLLEDEMRVLGADHPGTLTTRNNLASSLGEAGHVDEAIAQFAALLEDHMRVLGADHPHTLTTRNNLAFLLGEAGRVDEAIAQFAALLEDPMRVLGADHPDTLTTRNNLAFLLGEAGRVDEAIAQFTALLEDPMRVLGADHPHTLRTRNNLAFWLGGAGRVDEAIAQFTALLEDQMRVLGADHPHTLRTRNNLAFWLGGAGRVDEATAQFTALLEDQMRVLGADHPQTLTTRKNLAFLLNRREGT